MEDGKFSHAVHFARGLDHAFMNKLLLIRLSFRRTIGASLQTCGQWTANRDVFRKQSFLKDSSLSGRADLSPELALIAHHSFHSLSGSNSPKDAWHEPPLSLVRSAPPPGASSVGFSFSSDSGSSLRLSALRLLRRMAIPSLVYAPTFLCLAPDHIKP